MSYGNLDMPAVLPANYGKPGVYGIAPLILGPLIGGILALAGTGLTVWATTKAAKTQSDTALELARMAEEDADREEREARKEQRRQEQKAQRDAMALAKAQAEQQAAMQQQQQTQQAAGMKIAGIPLTTLLLVGGGLAAVLYFRSRKES